MSLSNCGRFGLMLLVSLSWACGGAGGASAPPDAAAASQSEPALVDQAVFQIHHFGRGEGKTGVFGVVRADSKAPFAVDLGSMIITGKSADTPVPSASGLLGVGAADGAKCLIIPMRMIISGGARTGNVGLSKKQGRAFLEILSEGAQVCLEFSGEFDLDGASIAFGNIASNNSEGAVSAEAAPTKEEDPAQALPSRSE